MSLESKYNIMKGLTEKNKWVKPELFKLNINKTKNGEPTAPTETPTFLPPGFIS